MHGGFCEYSAGSVAFSKPANPSVMVGLLVAMGDDPVASYLVDDAALEVAERTGNIGPSA